MWGVTPSDVWDRNTLHAMISKIGVRILLLVEPMPTASTSHILENNECFEPYSSNIYSRRVLSLDSFRFKVDFFILKSNLFIDPLILYTWAKFEDTDTLITITGIKSLTVNQDTNASSLRLMKKIV